MYHTKASDSGVLYVADYVDSMFGLRLSLKKDGRKRGLWVFLEEEINSRMDQDWRIFEDGMEKLIPELEKIFAKKNEKDLKMRPFEVRQALRLHLDYFLSHRTQGQGFRFTWKQLKKFIGKITYAEKAEKKKSEDWD